MRQVALAKLNTPPFDKIASILVNEPYFLSIEQIAGLTPFQVQYLYFRPDHLNSGNQQGSMAPAQVDLSLQAMFIKACINAGKTEEEARLLWDEDTKQRATNKAANAAKDAAERARLSKEAQAKWIERRIRDAQR